MNLPRGAKAILIGDFLSDPTAISATIESHQRARRAGTSRHDRRSRSRIAFPSPAILNSSMSIRRRDCGSARRKHSGQTIFAVSASHRDAIAAAARGARLDVDGPPDGPAGHRGASRLAGAARCRSGFNSHARAKERVGDVRHSARFHLSFRPRHARGSAAFVFSAAHHAAAPGLVPVSAAAAHLESSAQGTRRRRARLGGCCFCASPSRPASFSRWRAPC